MKKESGSAGDSGAGDTGSGGSAAGSTDTGSGDKLSASAGDTVNKGGSTYRRQTFRQTVQLRQGMR